MLWIQKHLKILLTVSGFVLLVIVGFFLNRRGQKVIEIPSAPDLRTELRAISAEAEAKATQAKYGAEIARQQIEAEHRKVIDGLNETQKRQAAELRADPAKLVGFLLRVGGSK